MSDKKSKVPAVAWVTPLAAFERWEDNALTAHEPGGPAFACPPEEAVHLIDEVRLVRAATEEEIRAATTSTT